MSLPALNSSEACLLTVLTRVNSGQSIRIRTLETEAAQLLEENIALREQVIKLTVELDRRDRSAELLENVSNTKRVLEKKVQEMLTLVGTLGLQAHMEKKGGFASGNRSAVDYRG